MMINYYKDQIHFPPIDVKPAPIFAMGNRKASSFAKNKRRDIANAAANTALTMNKETVAQEVPAGMSKRKAKRQRQSSNKHQRTSNSAFTSRGWKINKNTDPAPIFSEKKKEIPNIAPRTLTTSTKSKHWGVLGLGLGLACSAIGTIYRDTIQMPLEPQVESLFKKNLAIAPRNENCEAQLKDLLDAVTRFSQNKTFAPWAKPSNDIIDAFGGIENVCKLPSCAWKSEYMGEENQFKGNEKDCLTSGLGWHMFIPNADWNAKDGWIYDTPYKSSHVITKNDSPSRFVVMVPSYPQKKDKSLFSMLYNDQKFLEDEFGKKGAPKTSYFEMVWKLAGQGAFNTDDRFEQTLKINDLKEILSKQTISKNIYINKNSRKIHVDVNLP